MVENLFELAMDLAKLAPGTLPKFSELLDQQLTGEQKKMLAQTLARPDSPTPAPPQPARSGGARSGPTLKFVSGPSAPIVQNRAGRPAVAHNDPQVQALLATTRAVPHGQVKTLLLSVAKERRGEARVTFYFLCAFFIVCFVILLIGLFLLLRSNTAAGGILSAIGGVLSIIGGFLINAHQNTNKSLDTLIDRIQQA